MKINTTLIAASISKSKQQNLDFQKLINEINEKNRRQRTNQEQKIHIKNNIMKSTPDESSAISRLERILNGNDLTSVNYLAKGLVTARSVCRITIRNSIRRTISYGTGFLVAPGIIMTNNHVIANESDIEYAVAEFNYESDVNGIEKEKIVFKILNESTLITNHLLDFTLLKLSTTSIDQQTSIEEFGWLPLDPTPGKTIEGQYLTIIQHPGGELKQICVRENKLLSYGSDGYTLWYQTDTLGGSSGSPVFNDGWEVVGLHHSAVPEIDDKGNWLTVNGNIWNDSMDASLIHWVANEGIRISSILHFLQESFPVHELARAVIDTPAPLNVPTEKISKQNQSLKTEYSNGEMRVTVPVQIAVKIPNNILPVSQNDGVFYKSDNFADPESVGLERVNVDQTNYDQRPGYDPDFLGSDKLSVPLPIPTPNLESSVHTFSSNGKEESEIKYWNYSVLMHKDRKLAIFSAANLDMNQRPKGAGRHGDKWYNDPRVGKENEINNRFYKKQKEFEGRELNLFDRGHLTRRVDVQWGSNAKIAKRNGDDSFHWTNCAPQFWRYNQGRKRWLGLEEFVIRTYSKETGRACVINGPIFDAPLSMIDSNDHTTPKPDGEKHNDPTFGDVPIPKMYFKVVSVADNDKLKTAAFLMSQEEYLIGDDRIKGMPFKIEERLTHAEARLYQVKIADLEKIAGLDFGPLKNTFIVNKSMSSASNPKLIETFDDLELF